MAYVFLIIVLLVCLIFDWNTKKDSLKDRLFLFSVFIAFCFIAFRAPVVGADTWNYVRYFTGEQSYYNYDERELEPLFLTYNWLLHFFTYNGVVYLFVNTLISLAPIYYLVKKYSYNKSLSILLFFLLDVHMTYCVALRQILALSFILWGIIFVLEKRKYHWLWFAFFSLIAYFFHTSSIIVSVFCLTVYFVPISKRWVGIICIIVAYIVGQLSESYSHLIFFEFLDRLNISSIERMSNYFDTSFDNSFAYTQRGAGLAVISIGLFVFGTIDKSKLNNWIVKMYLLSIIIACLFSNFPMVERLNISFSLMLIIVFTWCFENKSKYRKFINILALIIISYLLITFVTRSINPDMNDERRMHPYYWFFENY